MTPRKKSGVQTVFFLFFLLKSCNIFAEPKRGELAKLGSRCVRNAEARGSNPLFSTKAKDSPCGCLLLCEIRRGLEPLARELKKVVVQKILNKI